jgi:lysophospholipase L1-like esterase
MSTDRPGELVGPVNVRGPINVVGTAAGVSVNGDVTARRLRPAGRGGLLGTEDLQTVGALSRWRRRLAVARTGGLSTQIMFIGDSTAEGFTTTRYRNRWIDRLGRRFRGTSFGSMGFLPASASTFSSVLDADWPGGDNPWTFSGSPTPAGSYGLGFHAISVPSGTTASFTYFGDKVTFSYVRTTDGPTAATMTIDGTSVGSTLNARGTVSPGLSSGPHGTSGAYGFHTFVITPNDGPLVLEGGQWFDGDAPFFFTGAVLMLDATHAGFSASHWAGSTDWSAMLNNSDAFTALSVIALGINDQAAARTVAQFQADLETIVATIDSRIGNTDVGCLFVAMPGVTVAFTDAMRAAADRIGPERAGVFDLAALRPDRRFGSDLSTDGSHPNDAGHAWIAEALGGVLDPTPTTLSPVTPASQIIHASTPPAFRSSWTASLAALAGTTLLYDEATASALRERRHRMWLDAGTYQGVLTAEHATGRGSLEVLCGNWQGNTPTLTSMGSVDTSTPAGPAPTTTVLATSVTTQVPGYCPVVIRKTNQANVGRFIQLALHKTA